MQTAFHKLLLERAIQVLFVYNFTHCVRLACISIFVSVKNYNFLLKKMILYMYFEAE